MILLKMKYKAFNHLKTFFFFKYSSSLFIFNKATPDQIYKKGIIGYEYLLIQWLTKYKEENPKIIARIIIISFLFSDFFNMLDKPIIVNIIEKILIISFTYDSTGLADMEK